MKLRYLFVDRAGQLVKVKRSVVERLWQGELSVEALGRARRTELRLVSALCDSHLRPRRIFLLRLPLSDGRFTRADYMTLQVFSRSDCVTAQEMIAHHTGGWPPDFYHQLAVALDIPRKELDVPVGIGGPLMTAAAMRLSPKQALRYLR